MLLSGVLARRGRVSALFASLGIALALTSLIATDAEARRYRKKHHVKHYRHAVYKPAYAAMVVDANSGRTLYADRENELRHPASITKVMTLYLLFEQLEKGRFNLETPIRISAHAAAQAPSKLGLRPGSSIDVEDAIKAVVTKSANDIAVAIGEAVGGDEETFAEMMTSKARSLGMSRTVYRNASGLPNSEQVTTARDLTVLGRSIQERFPRYYRYFSTHTFNFAGASHRNHNRLLGRVEGVDGIKTGYTRASGFNLLTSVKRDGHHIVSVVLGGRSGGVRDQIMANLVETHIDGGSRSRTASLIAEAPSTDTSASVQRVASAESATPKPVKVERVALAVPAAASVQAAALVPAATMAQAVLPVERPRPAVITGSPVQISQIQPVAPMARPAANIANARPVTDEGPASTASLGERKRVIGEAGAAPRVVAAASIAPATPSPMRWVAGANAAAPAKAITAATAPHPVAETKIAKSDAKTEAPSARPASAKSGWMIQIGATDNAGKATDLLTRAKAHSRSSLASAMPFTEKVQKGDATLYRARFAGLDTTSAEAACKDLKKSGFACFATKN